MKAEIKIWSNIGSTPITKRGGCYCDLLAEAKIEVDSMADARKKAKELFKKTEHAYKGFYYCPEEPNQNIRSGYINLSY